MAEITLEYDRLGSRLVRIGEVEVSLVPAGHILGSAQAVLEYRGQRIVVSGVQKLRPGARVMPMPPPGERGGPQGSAG